MQENALRLKTLLTRLSLTGSGLAKALNVDPAQVSRWVSGQRHLSATSEVMDKLCDTIVEKAALMGQTAWLTTQLSQAGYLHEVSSSGALQQGLALYLASDGARIQARLSGVAPLQAPPIAPGETSFSGCTSIAQALSHMLSSLEEEATFDIHLAREDIQTIVHPDVVLAITAALQARHLKARLLISLANDTNALSHLINAYMPPIVSAQITPSVVHGMTQAILNQMTVVAGDTVLLITETPRAASDPVALKVQDALFVHDLVKSFDKAANYAQPLLHIYSDSFARNILEIIYQEFCLPGDLDIVKDNLCPMYLTQEAYDRILRQAGHKGKEFKWRSQEFTRFKGGMDANLESGTVFREIISHQRLQKILESGVCRMPALYFMNVGMHPLDLQGCLDTLEGYVHCLETYPNYHLTIVEDIPSLNADCCWRLKRNHHMAMNYWHADEPFLVYSDQMILTHEFQSHFNGLWLASGTRGGGREATLATLKGYIARYQTCLSEAKEA